MKNINIRATFTNSDRVIDFYLSDVVFNMGSQIAEDVSLAEQIGYDFAYLYDNWNNVILEIIN